MSVSRSARTPARRSTSGLDRRADVMVVGGGIVGLAMADAIAGLRPQLKVTVLEKEVDVAQHASGRNSGVLHAGFYYAPESLKARLTVRGNAMLKAFARDNGVPLNECGKVVVATHADQLPRLEALYQRGLANGVELQQVDLVALARLEPLARSVQWAIWSPSTAVSDPVQMTKALAARAASRGVAIHTGSHVEAAQGNRVTVNGQTWEVGHLVNAAGLYADRIANWYGLANDYTMLPFKGLYWYGNWSAGRLRRHVYPVPNPENPFLGVHLTVTAGGGVKVGPTAIPALWRENYSKLKGISASEMAQILGTYPAFLSSPHHDVSELLRSELPKYLRRVLIKQASALVPAVTEADFRVKGAPGMRAQLWHRPTKRLEMDFVVRSDGHSTHLLNVVSPGWTTALAVAEHVVTQMAEAGAI